MKKFRWLGREWFGYLKLFLSLSLAIIALIGSLQYYFSNQIMKKMVYSSSSSMLLLFKENTEFMFDQTEKSLNGILSNSLFRQYMNYRKNQQYIVLLDIYEQLKSMAAANANFRSICIYYREAQYTLSSDYGPSALEKYYDREFLESLDHRDFERKLIVQREIRNEYTQASAPVITIVRTLPMYYSTQYPEAYVVINMDLTKMNVLLQQNEEGSNMFVLNENKDVVMGTVYKEAARPCYAALDADYEIRHEIIPIDGESVFVTYVKAEKSGWTYVYSQPTSIVMGDISTMKNTLLIVCALALLISLLLSFFFSHRTFAPIRSIFALFSKDDKARFEGNDWLIGQIDAMLSLNAQLEAERQKHILSDQDTMFMRLLKGSGEAFDAKAAVHTLGLDQNPEQQMTLLLANSNCSVEGESFAQFCSMLAEHGIKLLRLVSPSQSETILLLAFPKDASPDIMEMAECYRQISPKPASCSIGISENFCDPQALGTAYQQAYDALDMHILCEGGSVHSFKNLSTDKSLEYPLQIENRILKAVKNRDIASMKNAVIQFQEYCIKYHADANSVRSLYLQLFCSSQRLICTIDGGARSQSAKSYLDLIALESIFQMSGFMQELYTNTIQSMELRQGVCHSELIVSVCSYIDNNLSEDISLERLSAMAKVSSSYLRKAFRAEMQMTVKEYIDRRKIAMAKQLLTNRDIKVQEVASRLGFYYSQSFIAFFKAMVGMTPGEYQAQFVDPQNPDC